MRATNVFAMIAQGIPRIPMGVRNHRTLAVSHEAPIIGKESRIQIKEMGRRSMPKVKWTSNPRRNVETICSGITKMPVITSKLSKIRFAIIVFPYANV
jgi:hypothetical protein